MDKQIIPSLDDVKDLKIDLFADVLSLAIAMDKNKWTSPTMKGREEYGKIQDYLCKIIENAKALRKSIGLLRAGYEREMDNIKE